MKANKNLHYLLPHTISVVSSVLKVRTLQTRIPLVTIVRFRLETSRCNGVPALCPVFSGLQTGSCSLSPACQISLDALGGTSSFKWFSPLKGLPLRASQRTHASLRGSALGLVEDSIVDDPCLEPCFNHMFHCRICIDFPQ
jgi:hypothetical protein